MSRSECIALDGPAGAGKSTVGEILARELGFTYVDTGAFYRAIAWLTLRHQVDPTDEPAVTALTEQATIVIVKPQIADGRQYTVLTDGHDITWEIRSTTVTATVPRISSYPGVRLHLRQQQRALATQGNVVMVGRDIGTVVCPDAQMKVYLTASAEKRAERRYLELKERLGEHNPALPTPTAVLRDIQNRDGMDRKNMEPAEDAVIIDTDPLSISEVIATILAAREGKLHDTRK